MTELAEKVRESMTEVGRRGTRSTKLPYLRSVRESRGWGLRELARASNVDWTSLIDLEHGRTGAYRRTIEKLCSTLPCEEWELVGVDPAELSEEQRERIRQLLQESDDE